MRTYIFTSRERKVIIGFLDGKVDANNPAIKQVKSRIRHFMDLARDIDLYLRPRKAVAT